MDYLSPFDGPVFPGEEQHEVVYAKNQPEYVPLRCFVDRERQGRATSRWTLTADQRKAIASGADLYLTLLTFNRPMQPILMGIE